MAVGPLRSLQPERAQRKLFQAFRVQQYPPQASRAQPQGRAGCKQERMQTRPWKMSANVSSRASKRALEEPQKGPQKGTQKEPPQKVLPPGFEPMTGAQKAGESKIRNRAYRAGNAVCPTGSTLPPSLRWRGFATTSARGAERPFASFRNRGYTATAYHRGGGRCTLLW